MKRSAILTMLFVLLAQMTVAQTVTQTIKGNAIDVASGLPVPYATVYLEDNTSKATVTDTAGYFILKNVPVGRHTLVIQSIGYEPLVMKELLLSSGKEMVLNLGMTESVARLEEVVVKPQVNKQLPLNEMAMVGARMFSVEEASRYAGGVSDPARTASMFAGVAPSGVYNGISIHGNSPQMLQWRVEGIEVNNPNHFADITMAGGGIFTSLNGTVLANSDFLTGAMPAEYGNALSGAFDMKMRNGNNTKYEHALQFGTLGVDFASEGPLGKGSKASYLVNYRYSFMEIAKKIHAINIDQTMDYQDLSMKLNFPTKKAGTFGVWFTGLIDRFGNELRDQSEWESLWDAAEAWANQKSCAGGLTHTFRFGAGGTLTSSIAYTGAYCKLSQSVYDNDLNEMPTLAECDHQNNLIVSIQHKQKISSRYTMQNGVEFRQMYFTLSGDDVHAIGEPLYRVYESDGNTSLTRFYTNHKVALSQRFSTVLGINVMCFGLNGQTLVEPRASLQYKMSPSSSISVAYAQNSRKESLSAYFVKTDDGTKDANKELGLTRSHHISAAFAQRLGDNAMLKIEPYYQLLFDVPVEEGTTYSVINERSFAQTRTLTNDGRGRNYGIDLTLERYLKNGFYGMITGTAFRSEYRDALGDWHRTRYDLGYITNIVGGKEWMIGQDKKNVLSLNGRLTIMGGGRRTPVIEGLTYDDIVNDPHWDIPLQEDKPFSEELNTNVGYAFSVKYIINKERVAHHFILEYLNVKSYEGQDYNRNTGELNDIYTSLTFPNIAYRIEF
ncbi:MAG: carboxypeptidase-like regulatory domain-containing protein [Bacteroidales bacterium]|nr:carboxypeptidase-like regulatory domain-containing protein [Bacteroidales bacterium]